MNPCTRLFFALWPDAPVQNAILRIGDSITSGFGRRISRENLHLTVQFLGSIEDNRRQGLLETAAAITVPRFSLLIDTAGWWKPAQVTWLGPSVMPEELRDLHADLQMVARMSGLQVDDRAYRPHITLARKVTGPVTLQFEPIQWDVTDFCLAETITQTGYAEYRIIQHWALT